MTTWNSKYRKEYDRKRYQNNKTFLIKQRRERRQLLLAWVQEIKRNPCIDCKQRFHPVAMQFDHIKGNKSFNVSDMITAGCGWKIILQEIEKCELVCSNCHALRTFLRRGGGRK